MTGVATPVSDRLVVEVAEDRMAATVRLRVADGEEPPSIEQMVPVIKAAGLAITDAVKKRTIEFVRLCAANADAPQSMVIARGEAPFDGKDEEFIWDEIFSAKAAEWQGDAPVNYYSVNAITTIEKDTVIGTIAPLVPAHDGVDVKGKVLKAKGTPQPLKLDKTIETSPDKAQELVSQAAGRVVQDGASLRIDEALNIEGDVSFKSGNIDANIHVHISGSVPDRFDVQSTKSITVGGAIEAAVVRAEGDVVVRRGIVGRNNGRVTAGGEIVATFCNEADLRASGDVKIAVQVMNTRVHTLGRIIAERAAIIGGHLYAQHGGEVAALGSEACVPTRVFLGPDPIALKEVAAIDDRLKPKREAIERIERVVKPLMDNLKRLAPAQREQVTELMFKAQEAAADIVEEEERRDCLLDLGEGEHAPQLRVAGTIHPKVVLSLGTRQTVFEEEFKGPVSIETRKIKHVTELVAVNTLTGSITVLVNRRMPPEDLVHDYESLVVPDADESSSEET